MAPPSSTFRPLPTSSPISEPDPPVSTSAHFILRYDDTLSRGTMLRLPARPVETSTPSSASLSNRSLKPSSSRYNPTTICPRLLPDCSKARRRRDQISYKARMRGGVTFETVQPAPTFSGEFTTHSGWTMPRGKELKGDHPGPSPTYSNIDSPALSSPYHMPQSIVVPGGYQMVYPQMTHMPQSGQRMQMTPGATAYYAPPDVYQTPTPHPRVGKSSPYVFPPSFAVPQATFDGQAQLLTNPSLARSYDTTIPQYYPVTTDGRWYNGQASVEPSVKRKREKKEKAQAPPSTAKKPRASKQSAKAAAAARDSPVPKRARHESHSSQGSSVPHQLPTPPSTGRDLGKLSLPHEADMERSASPSDDSGTIKRRGVVVTRHEVEGRKLGIVGASTGGEEEAAPVKVELSPRTTTIPAITTDANGMAVFSTDQVLESEVAWMEYSRGQSPPSSPDMVQLQTPHLPHDHHNMLIEDQETPITRAERTDKRLKLFNESDEVKDDAMISTRIEMFGRVAVRKNVAIKFLGLDPSRSKALIEETAADDGEGSSSWTVRADRPGSSKLVRPSWPDTEAPWALAGSSRKVKMMREEKEKSAVIRRYLETASDESSDDEVSFRSAVPSRSSSSNNNNNNSKGKNVQRQPETTRVPNRVWPNPQADARTALLTSIRHRQLPPMPVGKVACACGATQAIGVSPMVECSGCKTYHHLACCGIGDDAMVGPQWWCPRCQSAAMVISTPARTSTPRVYTQSDERSSAFKGEMHNIALAPSPMFVNSATFTQHAQHTPLNRAMASPSSRQHRSRVLSYGTDMWAYTEDGAPSSVLPSTPRPARADRFSTPKIEETPFDVTSTPSRHLDFNFGQPSLFSLTPLGARSRFGSSLLEATPFPSKGSAGSKNHLSDGISRHDFLKELGKGEGVAGAAIPGSPATPGTRWPHALLGAHNLSPSPFGGRKASGPGGKLSSMRSSSKSGLGFGLPIGADTEEE
ncbi:hypothetical protein BD324DRAFT_652925 [Kockovaella imperatae]|uniref:Zinc finger PHD-type domain-containing protein n=1 Tax=Kockovaella imperatae TaxID=4999 RepID=A0A1Y1U9E9_9TREE|nr:hypothetical protein BD324DRAFT_652925 [Kockovaella imperatae]ORX34658.1 hypothetical protein BD324DRAFT_652925 [Kockovaella imperatae]